MKNLIILIIMCIGLVACNEDDFKIPKTVSGQDETVTIDENSVFNLTISGRNNTITVVDDNQINYLFVSGHNNIINIGKNVTIKSFYISGSDNTVHIPTESGITFDDDGSGNQLIEQ